MSRFNPTKDEQIAVLTQEREKFRGLFHKAQGMLDHDEIKRLRGLCCTYAAIIENQEKQLKIREKQIKILEGLKGIVWMPIPTDTPIM